MKTYVDGSRNENITRTIIAIVDSDYVLGYHSSGGILL